MIKKHILAPDRVRRPPQSGFSWIDRRFLREFSSRLSHDAVLLYFFLTAVSDKHGLSFYRDATRRSPCGYAQVSRRLFARERS